MLTSVQLIFETINVALISSGLGLYATAVYSKEKVREMV